MIRPLGEMRQFRCDSCGRMFYEFEFVETIEEFLCERCASGIDLDEEFDDFGMEDGFEDGFEEGW